MSAARRQFTTAEKAAVIEVVSAVAEIVRELGEVPSGHLYARLMDKMSLEAYEAVVGILIRSGAVKRSSHLLTWVGPASRVVDVKAW